MDGKAEKLLRVGKSEKVGFEVRKYLLAGETTCFKMVGRSRTDDCDELVCVMMK